MTPALTLNNSVTMPALGLGVFQSPPEETTAAVEAALRDGYRLIDTAAAYGNEREVGDAVRASGLERSEVFLETKIWISDYGYDETLHGFEKSAGKLGVEQIDLLILHQALPSAFDRTLEAYRALETLLADGKVRAIGVSNFMVDHLEKLLDRATVVPAVNQIEVHPYFAQPEVQAFAAEHGILDAGVVADRRHHVLPRRRAHQHPGGPRDRRDRPGARQEPRPGHAALGPPARTVGHPQVHQGPADRREHRRLRLRAHRRGDDRDRRARHGPPWRAGARGHHARVLRPRHPGGLTVDYRPLGRTGVQVSPLCLGTMMFGAWGNTDHDDSIRVIHAALDAGVNFVDTADVYSSGESEEIVGKALKGRRDDVVLATKFFMPMGEDPNRRGGSRRWIVKAVEDSLRRLDTDWIDLYQVHRPDPAVDVDETLGALTDLVRQGKVRYIGSSSYSGGEIVEAQWTARERRLERFRTEQPPYSLLTRGIELDVLPTAQRHGMGILTYSPLAGGWLSGSWTADSSPTSPARQRLAARFDMSLPENQRKLEAVQQLAKVADDAGVSMIELAIAFVVNHPAVTSAIVGPRTMEQLESQLPAADVALDAATLDRIDEIIRPGVNLNPADTSYGEQVLAPALRRR